MSQRLEDRLKQAIVDLLKFDDLSPDDIADDEPLFGAKIQFDSIDALELVVRLEKEYGIKIGSSEESKQALASVATLAAYIREHGRRESLPTAG
jgi:acyl carrier protein